MAFYLISSCAWTCADFCMKAGQLLCSDETWTHKNLFDPTELPLLSPSKTVTVLFWSSEMKCTAGCVEVCRILLFFLWLWFVRWMRTLFLFCFGSVLYFLCYCCGEMSILETAVCLAPGWVDVHWLWESSSALKLCLIYNYVSRTGQCKE